MSRWDSEREWPCNTASRLNYSACLDWWGGATGKHLIFSLHGGLSNDLAYCNIYCIKQNFHWRDMQVMRFDYFRSYWRRFHRKWTRGNFYRGMTRDAKGFSTEMKIRHMGIIFTQKFLRGFISKSWWYHHGYKDLDWCALAGASVVLGSLYGIVYTPLLCRPRGFETC